MKLLNRLKTFIVIVVLFATTPIWIPINIIKWVVTGHGFLEELMNWVDNQINL